MRFLKISKSYPEKIGTGSEFLTKKMYFEKAALGFYPPGYVLVVSRFRLEAVEKSNNRRKLLL
jgi:hypothetical protein